MLLAFAYESVRRSAAARDVVACLFWQVLGWASFGLLQHSNDRWTVPSACAAIYARRGAALGPRVARLRTHVGCNIFFFGCKTRDEKRKSRTLLHRKHPSHLRNQGWDLSPAFADFRAGSLLCFGFPSPKAKADYSDSFTLRTPASIAVQPHSFIVCRAELRPLPGVSNRSSLSGCYARRGSISQRPPAILSSRRRRGSIRSGTRHPLFRGGALDGAR